MQKKIKPYEDRIIIRDHEGTPHLFIPTGIEKGNKGITTLTDAKNKPSLLIKQNTAIDEWHFSGVTILDNQYYFYGPAFDGLSLEETLEQDHEHGLKLIKLLIETLLLLHTRGLDFVDFQTDSVYFLNDGQILFLQPELMNKIAQSRSEAYQLQAHEMINHPYMHSGEPCKSFTIAILLYKLFTSKFPFTATNILDLRNKIRILDVIDPALANPELKPEISDVIMKALKDPELITLEQWQQYCQTWLTIGTKRKISQAEKEQLTTKAQIVKEKVDKKTERKIFFERKGKTILFIASAAVVGLLILTSIIGNILKPRVTKGFSPFKVIETFYTSMNTFDHTRMEDCVLKKTAQNEIREVMDVFFQSRMTQAYEQVSYVVPADTWESKGRPALSFPYWVFGVTNLKIEQEQTQPEPIFIATYEKWNRKYIDYEAEREQDKAAQRMTETAYHGTKRRDRLALMLDKEDWVIYRFEILESQPIGQQ